MSGLFLGILIEQGCFPGYRVSQDLSKPEKPTASRVLFFAASDHGFSPHWHAVKAGKILEDAGLQAPEAA